jgi:hypothetical protein
MSLLGGFPLQRELQLIPRHFIRMFDSLELEFKPNFHHLL